MHLNLPRRSKKNLQVAQGPIMTPTEANSTCALDYMRDTFHHDRPIRSLNIIEESSLEIIANLIGISLYAARIDRTLK